MPISTNSIIHYTDKLEKLQSILKEGFAIKYCTEKLFINEDSGSEAAHPMICFCDIPLSQSYKHFAAYGRYGIGLSKDWANQQGINPVLYLEKNSLITNTIGQLLADRRETDSKLTLNQKEAILQIKSFAKNYSGELKRKDVNDPDYRYYDEREWRLVPAKIKLNGANFSVTLGKYLKNKDNYNKKISSLRFSFLPKDISYIIVDKTEEINNIINLLRIEYSSKCTAQELDILFSKIASTEQIISDY
jgi:hypothetical protein